MGSKLKLLKKSVSNIDLFVIVKELNDILQDGFISNVYELENNLLLLKCRSKEGKQNIIIDPQKRINFTNFNYPVPPYPNQFTLSLRKFLKGRRIERVTQHNLDRILIFELKSNEGESWKFVVELFGGGNYILINGDNLTIMAKSYKKMKDRDILAKKPYDFPPNRGIDIWNLTLETFTQEIQANEGEIVRVIARNFNVGGYLSEEICLKAEIEKKTKVVNLSAENLQKLYEATQSIVEILKTHSYSPRLIQSEGEEKTLIGYEPFPLKIYAQYPFEEKSSLNIAIDEFYSRFDSEALFSQDVQESQKKLSKQENILQKQLEKVEESKQIREESLEFGHLIYQYMYDIENLLTIIMQQKREKNLEWKEIQTTLLAGKAQGVKECLIFERILPKEMKLLVDLEGHQFKLDLKKTAIENADEIYGKAKKAKRKIVGATKAMEITKEKIDQQKEEDEKVQARKAILLKLPKAKWYDKFRWFISSDQFLIVGGRDASSNEAIVKKHMNDNDLFFHTDVRGASVCIIKNDENLEIPATTIKETANFASVYSSAWKNGWGSADIYYVYPNQVSKSPKSGEYLQKGSFIINGTKNFLEKPYLKICIGVQLIPVNVDNVAAWREKLNELRQQFKQASDNPTESDLALLNDDNEEIQFYPQIIASPESAIGQSTQNYVIIHPSKSKTKTSETAKKIMNLFIKNEIPPLRKWMQLIDVNDVIRVIPSGDSEISK